jgi:hypothetical protein
MCAYFGFNQHQINKQDDEIMLDVFIRELLAVGTLREADAFAEGAVVGFGVGGIEDGDGVAAGNAYWHFGRFVGFTLRSRKEEWERESVWCGGGGGAKVFKCEGCEMHLSGIRISVDSKFHAASSLLFHH